MDGWLEMLDEGKRYLAIAQGSAKSNKFSMSTRYNIAVMAFEKYVMALCMQAGQLPENHTITDLAEALKEFTNIDNESLSVVRSFENYQKLCFLDDYERKEFSTNELEVFISAVVKFCKSIEIRLQPSVNF